MLYVIEQLQLSRYVAAAGPKTDAMAEPPWRVYKKKKSCHLHTTRIIALSQKTQILSGILIAKGYSLNLPTEFSGKQEFNSAEECHDHLSLPKLILD